MLYLEYYRFRPAFLPFAAIARVMRSLRRLLFAGNARGPR